MADINVDRLLAFHKSHGKLATLTAVRPPARYGHLNFEGDAITVRTWVSNLRAVLSLRHYEILDAERNLLARAKTDWAFVDYAKQKPTRVPHEVIDCFTQVES